MSIRHLLVGLVLLASNSAFAIAESSVSYELGRLAHIVNTQVPYQYRTQLNMAIGRIEAAAEYQCGGQPT